MAIYCFPVTTCPAVLDVINWDGMGGGVRACRASSDCGITSVADGLCGESGSTEDKCTFVCEEHFDCPSAGFTQCLPTGLFKTCQ